MAGQDKLSWFRKHKIITIILILLILGGIGAAVGGGSSTKSNETNNSGSGSNSKTVARIGESARDGKFEFTITKMQCGIPQVGNEFVNKTAQGQYCELSMTVKNIGNVPQSLSSFNQYVYDAQNRKFTADDTATLYTTPNDQGSAWYNEINPGNTVSGVFVFDVPKDVTPVTAELHDSAYSGGIKVNLQ